MTSHPRASVTNLQGLAPVPVCHDLLGGFPEGPLRGLVALRGRMPDAVVAEDVIGDAHFPGHAVRHVVHLWTVNYAVNGAVNLRVLACLGLNATYHSRVNLTGVHTILNLPTSAAACADIVIWLRDSRPGQ